MTCALGTTARPKDCGIRHEVVVRSARAVRQELHPQAADWYRDPLPPFSMVAVLFWLAGVDAGAALCT